MRCCFWIGYFLTMKNISSQAHKTGLPHLLGVPIKISTTPPPPLIHRFHSPSVKLSVHYQCLASRTWPFAKWFWSMWLSTKLKIIKYILARVLNCNYPRSSAIQLVIILSCRSGMLQRGHLHSPQCKMKLHKNSWMQLDTMDDPEKQPGKR